MLVQPMPVPVQLMLIPVLLMFMPVQLMLIAYSARSSVYVDDIIMPVLPMLVPMGGDLGGTVLFKI